MCVGNCKFCSGEFGGFVFFVRVMFFRDFVFNVVGGRVVMGFEFICFLAVFLIIWMEGCKC